MLWDGTDHLPIGADAGSFQIQMVGKNAYFLLDDQHILTRLDRPSYALDSLRGNVSQLLGQRRRALCRAQGQREQHVEDRGSRSPDRRGENPGPAQSIGLGWFLGRHFHLFAERDIVRAGRVARFIGIPAKTRSRSCPVRW